MKWIKKIIGLWNKECSELINYSPLFLFQRDYYSIAWGEKHRGYFISSDGTKYSYDMPKKWNFYEKLNQSGKKERSWSSAKLSYIERRKLIKNLSACKMFSFSSKIEPHCIFSIIDELTNSDLIETMPGGCDMGLHSTSLLVLDEINNSYKIILLDCQGDIFLELNSDKRFEIYTLFKQTPNTAFR